MLIGRFSVLILTLACFAGQISGQTVFTVSTTISDTNFAFDGQDIVVRGCTVTINGAHSFNSLVVERSPSNQPGIVTHSTGFRNATTDGLHLTIAGNLTIQGAAEGLVASRMDVSGKGYAGGEGPGSSPLGGGGRAGASHAGRGGRGNSVPVSPLCTGDVFQPAQLGSGGLRDCGTAARGGGCIRLSVGGAIALHGIISADAGSVGQCGSGGGAGGSIWIECDSLSGAGSATAHGGPANRSDAGGGGGGRIAIVASASTFTGILGATGGGSLLEPGGAGSILLQVGDRRELTYDNGGTVGATSDVTGSLAIAGDLHILGHAQLSHAAATSGSVISVDGDALIDATSAITANGRGYSGGQGPGTNLTSGAGRAGASFGGRGGRGDNVVASANCYGSVEMPMELGSGGQPDCGTAAPGGGAFRIIVGGMLTVEGEISSNGSLLGACGSSGGSGGSLWIETGFLAGSGQITAHGGPANRSDSGGGGGGRIAVSFSASTFTGGVLATGGFGSTSLKQGGAGTVFVTDLGAGESTLFVDNGGVAGETTDLTGAHVFDAGLDVRGGARLSHAAATTGNHLMFSGDVLVESDGFVDLNGRGWPPGVGLGVNPGSGGGRAGSSHAGRGAAGFNVPESPNTYGDILQPVELGSGGQLDCVNGGSGGGALRLTCEGSLVVNGAIRADGSSVGVCGSGGPAGGSLWIEAASMEGTGSISANGGNSNRSDSGGGGGGRISLYASGPITIAATAAGGSIPGDPTLRRGGAGTVVTESESGRTLRIDNGGIPGQTTDLSGDVAFDGDLVVAGRAVLSHARGVATVMSITGDVDILQDAAISTAGRGFLSGQGPGCPVGEGGGRTGSSHGGLGGIGNSGVSPAATYGVVESPGEFGSGGATDCGCGAAGGGVLRLAVGGDLHVSGRLDCDGAAAGCCGSGGASGGSLFVKAGSVSGSGFISAGGGNSPRSDAGGGGGGRLALYSCEISMPLSNITSRGGTGRNSGQPGSVFLGSGSILVTQHPVSHAYRGGEVVMMSAGAVGDGPISYQWRRNGVPLVDDARISGVNTSTLTIAPVDCPDGGRFDCLFMDACGAFPSDGAVLIVLARADWNNDLALDSQDFYDFLEDFFAGDADFNGFDGTDSQDYFDFLEAFFSGC